jgi:hypothetical protein
LASPASRERILKLSAAAAAIAAAFHLTAIFSETVTRLEYGPTYPLWRHVLFIGIDSALVVLFLRRPRWFVWAFAALTIQILNGHGLGAWRIWTNEHRIEWISVAVSIGAPVILVVLVVDWMDRRRAATSGS